ncbi:DUF3108 domain-containing protein [Commensalibacter oyaizuii]|uniref:DUF3108 domain-containing protein n=1 Tax=Commensalibacter oyaizuii TaxID=3043873 RepID=A0ABT6Q1G7_9PROT|nr:DUF3108 domain-containing protein [Commensalibacter sp. TBRC 16381]MDI2090329.1 DUF3108 domain-containing protein [Commensalibacter sp. TBRC 16381]
MTKFFSSLALGILWIFATYCANVQAQEKQQQQFPDHKPVSLVYDVYNKGLHVITVKATYTLTPDQYSVKAHFISAGLASIVFSLDTYSTVSGIFKNEKAIPTIFNSHGKSKKEDFHIVIDFNHGQLPIIKTLTPARDPERDPLTDAQMQHSLDIMSAMAELIYRVRTTGKCDDQFRLIDGLRVYTFHSETVGEREMPSTWTSPYRGQALFCKAVAQQIGGLKHSRHRALMAQPQPGSIWFKNIDQVGILPVRFDFQHPKMGMVTGVLRKIPIDK